MKNIMRVMVDTNIIVSAGLFRFGSISLLLKEIAQNHEICICTFSLEELQLVMKRKFPERIHEMDDFLNGFAYELIYTPRQLDIKNMPYIRDKKDYPILAAALMADVDILLSGDADLLTVAIDRPEIMDAKSFKSKFFN